MAPWNGSASSKESTGSPSDRCLFCGESGHRATSDIHKHESSEGSALQSQDQKRKALAAIANDSKLTADNKRRWSGRVKAFWDKIGTSEEAGSP